MSNLVWVTIVGLVIISFVLGTMVVFLIWDAIQEFFSKEQDTVQTKNSEDEVEKK